MSNTLDAIKEESHTFVYEEKARLRKILKGLEVESEEVVKMGLEALDLGAEIASSKILGKDTELAEDALRVIRASIESAASSAAAAAVMGFVHDGLKRAASFVLRVAFAAL